MEFSSIKFRQKQAGLGLKNRTIARLMKVSNNTLVNWRKGNNVPKNSKIKKLASILQCEESELFVQ